MRYWASNVPFIHENLVLKFFTRFVRLSISLIVLTLKYSCWTVIDWITAAGGALPHFSSGGLSIGSNWRNLSSPPRFLGEFTVQVIMRSRVEKDVPSAFWTIFNFNSYSTKDSCLSVTRTQWSPEPRCRARIQIASLGRTMATSTP